MIESTCLKAFYLKNEEGLLYLFFGGIAFFLNVALFFLFNKVFDILLSNVISWLICILFQYFTNKLWVFDGKINSFKDFIKQLVLFFLGRVFTLLFEETVLAIFIIQLRFNRVPVKLIAQTIVIVLNYLISKIFIFRKE